MDSDEDGLYDDEEPLLGTDPMQSDTDGDGISDGGEHEAGTNPLAPDTDGDSYRDGDEVVEHHDPLDPEDRIYTGYWPYNSEKAALADPGWGGRPDDGMRVPRFAWTDQFGESVDIYDFAGAPVIISLAAGWCAECEDLAQLVAGESSSAYGEGYDRIPELIANGTLRWVTVLDADEDGRNATPEDVAAWAEAHPNEDVAVLQDAERSLAEWLAPDTYPAVIGLADDLTVERYSARDATRALEWAANLDDDGT